MYCQNCGSLVDDAAVSCPRCGQSTTVASPYASPTAAHSTFDPAQFGPKLPNYLVQSILVTLFCCLPFGVVAIIYAAKVDGKQRDGDYQGALEASANAKKWCWVAFTCGLVAIALRGASLVSQHH